MLVLAERCCLHFVALVWRQCFCWTFDVLTPCKVGFQIFWRLWSLFGHLSIWFDVIDYTNFERTLNSSLSLCTLQILQSVMADDNGRTGTSKRAANVSASERQLLVDLVSARADVIENKKTDGATSREKEAAWVAVAANFNSISTVKRQHRQLKQVILNIVS